MLSGLICLICPNMQLLLLNGVKVVSILFSDILPPINRLKSVRLSEIITISFVCVSSSSSSSSSFSSASSTTITLTTTRSSQISCSCCFHSELFGMYRLRRGNLLTWQIFDFIFYKQMNDNFHIYRISCVRWCFQGCRSSTCMYWCYSWLWLV